MRKAPRKEKGGLSRPGLIEIWQARDRLIQLPAQTKNRDQRRAPNWPAAGPDLSRFSEFERHRGCGFTRLGDPQWRRQETAPRPGAIRFGGGRPHSPGAAHPSLVWLPITLGTLCLIFCKSRKTSVSYWPKWRLNCRRAGQIGREARGKPDRACLVPAGVQSHASIGASFMCIGPGARP